MDDRSVLSRIVTAHVATGMLASLADSLRAAGRPRATPTMDLGGDQIHGTQPPTIVWEAHELPWAMEASGTAAARSGMPPRQMLRSLRWPRPAKQGGRRGVQREAPSAPGMPPPRPMLVATAEGETVAGCGFWNR